MYSAAIFHTRHM